MDKKYDAIIIGAGVIGSAISFELSKKGYKTVNIDRNPTSGYGSTAASCAIIRVHYSTFDGVRWHMKDIITGRTGRNIWNLMTKVD